MIYIVKQNGEECTSENFPDQKQGVLSAKFRSYKDAVRFLWFWEPKTLGSYPKESEQKIVGNWIDCKNLYIYSIYTIEIQENK